MHHGATYIHLLDTLPSAMADGIRATKSALREGDVVRDEGRDLPQRTCKSALVLRVNITF